jgi:hypothetical protein
VTSVEQFSRCLCLAVDVQGYGRGDDRRQFSIQDALVRIVRAAAEAARLDPTGWTTQGAGDAELALIPGDWTEPLVVDDFVRELDATLYRYNRDRVREAWIRLRVAVHHGVGYPASNGFAGQGVVVVSRLLNSAPVRAALAATDANLAVIVSRGIFDDVIRQGHTSLRPDEFRRVEVREKEYVDEAWLRVPGANVHMLTLGEPGGGAAESPAPDPARQDGAASHGGTVNQAGRDLHVTAAPGARETAPAAPSQTVHNELRAERIDARHSVFGISN